MKHERLSDHMKQRYEIHYGELETALRKNVDLTVAGFCREHDIDCRSFTAWILRYKGKTPMQVRNGIRKTMGIKELTVHGGAEYERYLESYKKMLAIDISYSLRQFCEDMGLSAHGFDHWLHRKGLGVEKIRQEVCVDLGIDPDTVQTDDVSLRKSRQPNPAVFKRALSGYKKMLVKQPKLSLQTYCRAKGYAYRQLSAWMKDVGISTTDIKEFVEAQKKLPKDNRHVFIKFKPNGGASGDLLHGVRISLPDGTQIDVEDCTVVSLCSFVNIYTKQNEV